MKKYTPLKFNMDTQNSPIWKEIPFCKPSLGSTCWISRAYLKPPQLLPKRIVQWKLVAHFQPPEPNRPLSPPSPSPGLSGLPSSFQLLFPVPFTFAFQLLSPVGFVAGWKLRTIHRVYRSTPFSLSYTIIVQVSSNWCIYICMNMFVVKHISLANLQ